MSDPFALYEYSNDIFEQYAPADSCDWLHHPDSKEALIKISQHSLDMMDSDEKGCIRTGLSLHEEFKMTYDLIPHKSIEPDLAHESDQPLPEEPAVVVEAGPLLRREKRQIEISTGTICLKSKAEKGDRFQTKNICKHLHTETAKFLKNGLKVHQFEPEETQVIRQFCRSNISIDSFKTLLKNARICSFMKEIYESKYYLREVMTSKMEMKAKLTMIKYLERIRSITYDPNFKAWKKNFKEFS